MHLQYDVKHFMELCGQITHSKKLVLDDTNAAQMELYRELIAEEFRELEEAMRDKNIEEIADACGDIIWVVLGLMNTCGIPLLPVWEQIYLSNMSKTQDGKIVKREDGKILKPDTYFPPDIKRALNF